MGREVLPLDKDYILDILDDVFFYIKQGSKSFLYLETKFSRPDVSFDEFFVILEPFFISSFESLAQSLSRVLIEVLRINSKDFAQFFLKILIQSF